MFLAAMARVTRICEEKLTELSHQTHIGMKCHIGMFSCSP